MLDHLCIKLYFLHKTSKKINEAIRGSNNNNNNNAEVTLLTMAIVQQHPALLLI